MKSLRIASFSWFVFLAAQAASAQANWTPVSPASHPIARWESAMAYDPLHQQVVLFGGSTGSSRSTATAETWVWDGTTWTQLSPATSPPGRSGGTMVYDFTRNQIVLFGGDSLTARLNDTWVWDGNTWTQKFPANSPQGRIEHAFAYDQQHQQAVLFGGINSSAQLLGDTWTWDGVNWTQQSPVTSPSARFGQAAVYDAARMNVVMFGGQNTPVSTVFPIETWLWDGSNWTLAAPANTPSGREVLAFAYDAAHQLVTLFGGFSNGPTYNGDTWVWDGTNWTQLTLTPSPAGRITALMVYDDAEQRIVLFGGKNAGGNLSDTWLFQGSSLPGTVNINVPAGIQFTFDGQTYTGSQSINIASGSYTLSTNSPQSTGSGTQSSFVSWSDGGGQSHTVTVGSTPVNITGTFQTQYSLTINVPAGIQFTLSGFPYTGPQTIPLPSGTYSLGLNSPQAMGFGTQSVFVSWSDGGAQSHTIVLGSAPVTVTGTFKTQYLLSVASLPTNGGSAGPSTPGPSAPYYDAGSPVVLLASPNSGFDFEYWGGACTGSNPFCLVIMTAPMNVNANFSASLQWFPSFPAGSPTPRQFSSMAYDSARQQMVLFGGTAASGAVLGDTWVWDGTNWTHKSPVHNPPARFSPSLAYDAAHQQVVLFGGYSNTYLADTWLWDGTDWTQAAATGPPKRYGQSMVYDAARQQVVLFGGVDVSGVVDSDTWTWDGAAWTQKSPAGSVPPGRYDFGMTYDATRQQVVLFGGSTFGGLLGDTWVWNGTAWTQKNPVASPSARSQLAMAYDGLTQQVILFAGFGGDFSNVTWFWDGVNWTQRSYPVSPTDRDANVVAYDSTRQQLVLFGGYGSTYNNQVANLNDTWIYANNVNPAQFVLTTSVTPLGSGAVTQSAPGQPGPAYYAGSKVMLTAVPNTGFDLQSWSGACMGISPCLVTMNASQSVTANFGPERTWAELFPAVSPITNNGEFGAMAYDKARNQTVLLDEQSHTWTFDGITWTLRSPPTNLNGYLRQLVYDEANSQIVAAGGNGVFETWVWDGNTWTQKFPSTQPSVRASFGLAYNGAIGKVVLFGGAYTSNLNDTWLWDGNAGTWTQILPAHVPVARVAPSMAYDTVRQVVLLFGGLDGSAMNDTWTFTGADWTLQGPATPPPARDCAAMTWDEAHQQMVLFGGTPTNLVSGTFLADTWLWDGMNWVQRTPILSPPARACSVMAYDTLHQQPVLFGGVTASGFPLSDTWIYGNNSSSPTFTLTTVAAPAAGGTITQSAPGQTPPTYLGGTQVQVTAAANPGYEFENWSGACTGFSPCNVTMGSNKTATANFGLPLKWVQMFPASSPQPLAGDTFTETVPLAYDAARQQIVLFGGAYGGQSYGNQTWVWDGVNWTQKFPATIPPGRNGHSLAYDQVNQQVVMFGGQGSAGILSDTWVWDGANWTQKAMSGPSPSPRLNHRMSSDGQHVVLFGGWIGVLTGDYLLSDTWVWDGTAWTQKSPASHPTERSDFGMAYDAARQQVVLFGGLEVGADTWVWDGTNWTQKSTPVAPPKGYNVMAYDSLRQQIVMFDEALPSPQTWVWDGTNWLQRTTASRPSYRFAAGMAYHAATQQTVLFGGNDIGLGQIVADTWVWLPPSVNLVPQTPSVINDGTGNYLVTFPINNQGNIPITSLLLNSAKLGNVAATSFVGPTALSSVAPGSTASFTAKFPIASIPGRTASVTFQGSYSAAGVIGAGWTASVRQVNLP